MQVKRNVFLAVLFALLMVVPVSAQTFIDQTLFLTFVPNVQFSPVYVALEKGYFADAGINLTIEHGDEPVGVDLIAAGQRQFGIIGGEQVIAARANERPVQFVYKWFHSYPIAIIATENSGIESIEDLRGRRVGVPGRFGATYSGLVAVLAANGMVEGDIQLQEIGFNAPEVVCVGGVEAAAVYINNEPLQIANRIAAGDCGDITGITVFPVAEQVALVSNGLITNEETIANDPELVTGMVTAFYRGVRDVMANPAEAYLISAEYVENLPLTDELRAALETIAGERALALGEAEMFDLSEAAEYRAGLVETLLAVSDADTLLQFSVLLETISLWEAEQMGMTNAADWETTQQTLITMGFLAEPIDVTEAFTNEFVPLTVASNR